MNDLYQNFLNWALSQLTWWKAVGIFGQSLFMMRFIVQWVSSEKAKRSVMPEAFWYFSLAGGMVVLIYAIHAGDAVFIFAQAPGVLIYIRNIQLIWRRKRQLPAADGV